jgi:hypothetical protein
MSDRTVDPTRPERTPRPDGAVTLPEEGGYPVESIGALVVQLQAIGARLAAVDAHPDRSVDLRSAEAFETIAAHSRLLAILARAETIAPCPSCGEPALPGDHVYCSWRAEALAVAGVAR